MNESTVGREPIQIVEIYQPSCSLTYGVSPCTAVLGTTGSNKCFNTSKTCQDTANYSPLNSIVWRFTKPDANRTLDIFESTSSVTKTNAIPSLVSISTNPTKINVGGGAESQSPFGTRASVNIQMKDFKFDDSIGDKYVTERSYNAFEQGTFWGKWLARNPYYNGYKCIVYTGYTGQLLSEMTKRSYLITNINRNASAETITITAKDPLNLADDKRSKAPMVNEIELLNDIDAVQTTGITVVCDETELSEQLGNTGTTRYIRLGDEIMLYTGYSTVATNTFTLSGVFRGQLGTVSDSATAEDALQRVIRYENYPVWDVAYDLLINHTDVPSSYIPYAKWLAEGSKYLPQFNLTAVIEEPTAVNDLLGELTEQCLFYMWWDERTEEILIQAIRPKQEAPTALTDEFNIIGNSLTIKEDPRQRISRCAVYYGKRNPTGDNDKVGNFALVRIHVNADSESQIQYNEVITRTIYSRWLTTKAQATQLAVRLVVRYSETPKIVTFRLDAKDRNLWLSEVASINHFAMQDDIGSNLVENWQIISANEVVHGEIVQYDAQRFEFTGRFFYWMADTAPVYTAATEEEKSTGGWWARADGKMSDGSDGFKWQ